MSPPSVLVIDDSELALAMVRAHLEENGFRVSCAADLATFEKELSANPPSLILVDVQMPETFGDDLAKTLRGAYGVTAPILLFSNLDEGELAERVRLADLDGFVSKRAGMDALLARVQQVLGARLT